MTDEEALTWIDQRLRTMPNESLPALTELREVVVRSMRRAAALAWIDQRLLSVEWCDDSSYFEELERAADQP